MTTFAAALKATREAHRPPLSQAKLKVEAHVRALLGVASHLVRGLV